MKSYIPRLFHCHVSFLQRVYFWTISLFFCVNRNCLFYKIHLLVIYLCSTKQYENLSMSHFVYWKLRPLRKKTVTRSFLLRVIKSPKTGKTPRMVKQPKICLDALTGLRSLFLYLSKHLPFDHIVFLCLFNDFGGENEVEMRSINKIRLKPRRKELLPIPRANAWNMTPWFKFCSVL